MPRPPMDAAMPNDLPSLEFTKLEGLLIAYHSVGKQLPEDYFSSPDIVAIWDDFKVQFLNVFFSVQDLIRAFFL